MYVSVGFCKAWQSGVGGRGNVDPVEEGRNGILVYLWKRWQFVSLDVGG